MDTRPLETVRRKMPGAAGEWSNLAPLPDATSVAWGAIESLAELLRTVDAALEQLRKTTPVVPASGGAG
jgi:hypothetical protein